METNTQTKWFLLFLTPCLALFICQWPSYLFGFSESWEEVLPAPPANTVMIAGATGSMSGHPNMIRTKSGEYYEIFNVSRTVKGWRLIQTPNEEARDSLIAGQYKFINSLIPFLFNRPPGTVIDHFYTEHLFIESGWPRHRVYYVLLDGGTLWSWSDPLSLDYHRFFNRVGVISAVIVFGVTGVMLSFMNRVGKPLPSRKPNQLLRLIFPSLAIGLILTMFLLFLYSSFGLHIYFDIFSEKSSEIFLS